MKQNTPMQELIQWLNPLDERTLAKATELLEREKAIIISAAAFVPDVVTYKSNKESAEKYFNDTFNNQ